MHELSYCISLVNMACENADTDKETITELVADVGVMTGVVPEYLIKYFPEAAKGTAAEGAVLTVNQVPVEGECLDCKKSYRPSAENGYSCPYCKSLKFDLKHGREFELINIKVKKRSREV
ncbi:MAG: hydrogenase maturation nickel metallochaperone HypA [Lachnospiraceae bacterium]|nr:hydrogenase maturation nickel metallochaperone HypA [Lachnospiraceae bacterium]